MSDLEAVRRTAVWVTSLHTGGCTASAQSIAALAAPRYAAQLGALGVTLTRVPRHGAIILLCGALTENAHARVSEVLAGAPHPCALVAVGDCAVNGCVFAGSRRLSAPLAQQLDVNIEIGGCPPSPQAIITAIAEAQRLLSAPTTAPTTPGADALADAPPDDSGAETTAASPSPDRATHLAALIEAARDGWDDDDTDDDDTDDDDTDDDDTDDDELTTDTPTTKEHLTGTGNGASAPAPRQSKEKRR